MFGSSPISAAPFSALAGGVNFDSAVDESVVAVDSTSAIPVYLSLIAENNIASDAAEVSESIFNTLYSEAANISDTVTSLITVLTALDENIQLLGAPTSLAVFPVAFTDAVGVLDLASAAVDFSCAINESSQASELVSAAVLLLCSITDSSALSDSLSATLSYPATVNESTTGTASANALIDFSSLVTDTVIGTDVTQVAPSTFNASVVEQLDAVAEFFSAVVFIANTAEGATAADQLLASFLWELIDTAQTAEWTQVNDSQSVTWNVTLTNS